MLGDPLMTARGCISVITLLSLSACGATGEFDLAAVNPFKAEGEVEQSPDADTSTEYKLMDLIASSSAAVNVDIGFEAAMRAAIETDPAVLAAKSEAEARRAAIKSTAAGKDFNYSATVLGGVEDVTDEIAGVAAILKASRVVFDGGQIDAKITAETFAAQAAEARVAQIENERGARLAYAWIELERYGALQGLIDSRLGVLDPLLSQLEKVALSGMGDAGQVAAAQRTVSMIRVTQTDVAEKLAQATVVFKNNFGSTPKKTVYDHARISRAVPKGSPGKLAETAPGLLAEFYGYRAAEANVTAVKSLDNYSVAFEAKAQKPFGNSDYSSDESIGLVLTKKFYTGEQLTSRIENAEAAAKAQADKVRSTYRAGERAVLSARQMIVSMDKAIELARSNAQITRDEIEYLRKQLVIGGSTLDSVLSAEARLYDAEAKEISFIAERRKAEVTILATSGHLRKIFGS